MAAVAGCPRLFVRSDEACTCGQLVVASRESQYKIFHFHHGGLDKLSEVFQQWKYCTETHLKDQVPARPPRGTGGFSSDVSHRVFLAREACWRSGAVSSCHHVRQKAALCWCRVGHNCESDTRSLLCFVILVRPWSACAVHGRTARKPRRWRFCRPGRVGAGLQAGKSAAVGLKSCQSLSSIL